MQLKESKQALLFYKKEAKNFHLLRALATPVPRPPVSKSFLVLFFKKEPLPSLPYIP
jgi:hypothetical protein